MSDKKEATSGAVKIVGMNLVTDEKDKVIPTKGKVEIKGIQLGEQTISIPLVPNKEKDRD